MAVGGAPWSCGKDDQMTAAVHAEPGHHARDSVARLAAVKARRVAPTRLRRAGGLDSDSVEPTAGIYVMSRQVRPDAKKKPNSKPLENVHVRHIGHAQHRSDDRSADAPLLRLHHDYACRARRSINAHALRRPAQRRRGLYRRPRDARRAPRSDPFTTGPHRQHGARMAARTLPISSPPACPGGPGAGGPQPLAAVALAATAEPPTSGMRASKRRLRRRQS